MKKNVFGRRLKRDKNERKALFKALMSSLVLHERIKTTEAKAKAVKGLIEKLVTKAKKKGKDSSLFFHSYLNQDAIQKIVSDIAPRFEKRSGGYTRLVRIGSRFSDNASMVLMEWVEGPVQGIEDRKLKVENRKEAVQEKKKVIVKKSVKRGKSNKKPATTEAQKRNV